MRLAVLALIEIAVIKNIHHNDCSRVHDLFKIIKRKTIGSAAHRNLVRKGVFDGRHSSSNEI